MQFVSWCRLVFIEYNLPNLTPDCSTKKIRKCTNCWMSHHNRANGFAMYQWYTFPSINGKSNF